MSKKFSAFCLATCLVVLTPARADYSALQASTSGFGGQTVIVSVHNPTSGPVSARVRVAVQLDEDAYFLLTSPNFTIAAGATASISLTAPEPVVAIEDDPEPIGIIQ
jgi:P pilus assembly chaperone PapD